MKSILTILILTLSLSLSAQRWRQIRSIYASDGTLMYDDRYRPTLDSIEITLKANSIEIDNTMYKFNSCAFEETPSYERGTSSSKRYTAILTCYYDGERLDYLTIIDKTTHKRLEFIR